MEIDAAILAERKAIIALLHEMAEGYEAQEQEGWQYQRSDELRWAATMIRWRIEGGPPKPSPKQLRAFAAIYGRPYVEVPG